MEGGMGDTRQQKPPKEEPVPCLRAPSPALMKEISLESTM